MRGKARLASGDGSPCVIAVLDKQRACPSDAEGVFWGRRALSMGVGLLLLYFIIVVLIEQSGLMGSVVLDFFIDLYNSGIDGIRSEFSHPLVIGTLIVCFWGFIAAIILVVILSSLSDYWILVGIAGVWLAMEILYRIGEYFS